MLKSIIDGRFPKLERTIWLGLFRKPADQILIGGAIISYLICIVTIIIIAMFNSAPSIVIISITSFIIGCVFLFGFLSDVIPVPLRIDFSSDRIDMIHLLGKKQFSLSKLKEVRLEEIHQRSIVKNDKKIPYLQLVWEFDEADLIRFDLGRLRTQWQNLLDQLENHEWITFFPNKTKTFIRYDLFGTGSTRPMDDYLKDQTAVTVNSLDEMKEWLKSCKYIRDIHQFGEEDHWFLPSEFEQQKQGDCEDHALWAWNNLKKLGIPAEFVTGIYKMHTGEWGGHAWVMFQLNSKQYVFETVDKSGSMVHPWEAAKEKYRPGLSINHKMETYHYREME